MEKNLRSSNQRYRRSECTDEELIARRDVDRMRRQASRQNMTLESIDLRRETDSTIRQTARQNMLSESLILRRETHRNSGLSTLASYSVLMLILSTSCSVLMLILSTSLRAINSSSVHWLLLYRWFNERRLFSIINFSTNLRMTNPAYTHTLHQSYRTHNFHVTVQRYPTLLCFRTVLVSYALSASTSNTRRRTWGQT